MRERAKKSLGQHYLVNEDIGRRIVQAVHPLPGDLIFEIGPGTGALTSQLAGTGAETISFEIDGTLCGELRVRFADQNLVEIVQADVLEIDFDGEAERRGKSEYKILGNIPYMLTSSILIKLPDAEGSRVSVIMIQKEVAERILEEPGNRNCGIMTVFLRSYLEVEKVADVGAGSFRPRPRVDSTVLRFFPSPGRGAPDDRDIFFRFLKIPFSKRRKKLRNSLLDLSSENKRRVQKVMEEETGIDMNRRAENLKLEEWFRLFRAYESTVGFDETR